jgi:threonine aldolase
MIDLRSDTVTKPTAEMRKAMYKADVGDDVYGEDPTINKLEELASEILGKKEALFVTSGTQGNQIAVLTYCQPGNEVILEEDAHIFYYEGGAISAFAGVQTRTIKGTKGAIDPFRLEQAIRGDDIHYPETGLICLENTHNRAGGAVVPVSNMKDLYEIGQNYSIPIHLDGARLFNAAVSAKVDVREFTKYTDSVQICLSKGLGAPVGSIIAGNKDFINKARKWRKRLGGGLRQGGVLAAPGIISLTNMVSRLDEDHENATYLANRLKEIHSLSVTNDVDTNIVVVDISSSSYTVPKLLQELKQEGVLAGGFGENLIRLVTSYEVSKEDIDKALTIIQNLLGTVGNTK